jgi:polysaccharide pyruvyl transferase WcaK-like protein
MLPSVKTALFGMFGVGNLGNEASLEAMLRYLRHEVPRAELLCICPDPTRVSKYHRVRAVPTTVPFSGVAFKPPGRALKRFRRLHDIASWRHALRALGGTDSLVIPGTGILDDFGTSPRGMPYDLFRWCMAARIRGARVKFASVGAGPIRHPASRWLMKTAARLADYRSFRDTDSQTFLASLGCRTHHDPVVPDLVFSLPTPFSTVLDSPSRPLTVGVGVMAYFGWSNDATAGLQTYRKYLADLAEFVLWLLQEGCKVRLLIGESADFRASRDLMEVPSLAPDLHQGRFRPAVRTESIHDLLEQIATTQIVVATRYHNIVAALMLNKPVVSLGYAPKNRELLADMGMPGYCQDVERLDLPLLKRQFLEAVERRSEIGARIERRLIEYRQSLADQFEALFRPAGRPATRVN